MSTTKQLSEEVRRLSGLVADLRGELASQKGALSDASSELETERLRLAACSTAALGYFIDCAEKFKSAALDDVLSLRKRARESEAYAEECRRALEGLAVEAISVVGIVGCKLCKAEEGARGLVHAPSCLLADPRTEIGQRNIESTTESSTESRRAPSLEGGAAGATHKPALNDTSGTAGVAPGLSSPHPVLAVGNAVLSPVIEDAALGLLDGRVGEHWHDFRWAAAKREQIAFVEGAQLAQRTTSITGDGWMKEEARRRYILPLSVKPFVAQPVLSQVSKQEPDHGR